MLGGAFGGRGVDVLEILLDGRRARSIEKRGRRQVRRRPLQTAMDNSKPTTARSSNDTRPAALPHLRRTSPDAHRILLRRRPGLAFVLEPAARIAVAEALRELARDLAPEKAAQKGRPTASEAPAGAAAGEPSCVAWSEETTRGATPPAGEFRPWSGFALDFEPVVGELEPVRAASELLTWKIEVTARGPLREGLALLAAHFAELAPETR